MWKYENKKGYWHDPETGEVLHANPEGPSKNLEKIVVKAIQGKRTGDVKNENKNGEVECPGHTDAILVLKKKVNVWAGSANKTNTYPVKALIVDLANRYGNGLKGEGIELPPELLQKRLVVEWPDMGKPYLFKKEWEILTEYLLKLDVVREHGLYIACLEGHGRTGTALALLAHYFDEWNDNVDVVRQIRKKYCKRAVETSAQIEYFEKMTGRKTKCIGSTSETYTNGTTTTRGGPVPCFKTVQGVQADCQHTCACKTGTHTEHWCDKCKWDWWVNKEGLFEKPSPSNKAANREPVCTPGVHLVKTLDASGSVTMTESYTNKGVLLTPTMNKACWNTSPIALGGDGKCEQDEGEHMCGVDKEHPGRHMCMMCSGVWDNRGAPDGTVPPMPEGVEILTEGLCMAEGGQEHDHICSCREPFGHEGDNYLGMVHSCETCSKFFEEGEGIEE